MINMDVIYGKNKDENIVNISIKNDTVFIFKETADGVWVEEQPYRHWVLAPKKYNESFTRLNGDQHYCWYKEYNSLKEFYDAKRSFYKLGCYTAHNFQENFMLRHGYTYFKGMKVKDVSVLSFDIETTGLDAQAEDAEVLLVTNTFRKEGFYESKTFCVSDYSNDKEMLLDWAAWVCEKDPSIILGHNIVLFDIPYILERCPELPLGRFGELLTVDDFVREFRKDGSQTYSYKRVNCFGREIIDTFFVSIKYDIKREFENYRLKSLIAELGLEEEGRQHYDGSEIRKNWHIPEERKKIIAYAEADSRDPIKLYDKFIDAFFYLTPHIPKPFQIMIESATGSQINALMVRAYLQNNDSVAKPSDSVDFEGAISFGNVGIYDNVFKVDVSSLYPSVMLQYKISPKGKDYHNYFLSTLEFFTKERLKNKKIAEQTKDPYYKGLQESQKAFINSAYGFMGASGLHYNDPEGAATVTRYGREVVTKSVIWATGRTLEKVVKKVIKKGTPEERIQYEWVLGEKVAEGRGYEISNCDTDSISFTTGRELTKQDRIEILEDLNSLFPSGIRFADDGYFKRVCILKTKNYILWDAEKNEIIIKGSALKDQKKEPALREMMDEMIHYLIHGQEDKLNDVYIKYIKEALNPKEIKRWSSKKTVTKALLNCATNPDARANEKKPYMAIKDIPGIQEGDKVYLYPNIVDIKVKKTVLKNGKVKEKVIKETALKVAEQWQGDHDSDKLIERIVDTVDIFSGVTNIEFVDYTLQKNKSLLMEINNG